MNDSLAVGHIDIVDHDQPAVGKGRPAGWKELDRNIEDRKTFALQPGSTRRQASGRFCD
jgi:hypothetical protein